MVHTIVGVATGYPQQILLEETNHAWNSIWLGDGWYLLDVTWGAGYITEDKEFVRFINDAYFLTEPEEFIKGHFPDDMQWQLLDHPISFDEFFEMAVRGMDG
jgi:transglutaminase/protease-like cytokinesis protein 3